jgi:arginyl-tRNA synthetase
VSDGALCVFTDGAPLIIRKSDGGFGYAATDLAAIRHRVDRLHADRILYVVDARQALHFRQVFETARRAGWLPAGVEAVHVAFGTMLGSDGRPFKYADRRHRRSWPTCWPTRCGGPVTWWRRRTRTLDGATLDERARQVGIGALKYAELSTGRTRD